MTLYCYFERDDSVLPKPQGTLSTVVPASTIAAANEAVKTVLDSEKTPARRTLLVATERTSTLPRRKRHALGKRAAEHGVTATLRFFSKAFPGRPLKESSV